MSALLILSAIGKRAFWHELNGIMRYPMLAGFHVVAELIGVSPKGGLEAQGSAVLLCIIAGVFLLPCLLH
jgi:hypothetical protein